MITALSAHDLALDRGGRRLLERLSFQLRSGEALALTGPNGAGKTSLLRAVAGLLRPAAGAVRFTGVGGDLDAHDARAALHWLGAADGLKAARTAEAELHFWIGWAGASQYRVPLPQSGGGGPEEVGWGFGIPSAPSVGSADISPASGRETPVRHALDQLGLLPHARTAVRRLSTGQRRRLALARLLAAPRPLWLLDEPLAPLDAAWRVRLGEIMRVHLDGGGLILAAVHDPLPVPAREFALDAAA